MHDRWDSRTRSAGDAQCPARLYGPLILMLVGWLGSAIFCSAGERMVAPNQYATTLVALQKPAPKAKKPRVKPRVQRLVVQQGFYRSDQDGTDLTQRLQQAVTDDVLVVFVEKSLASDPKHKQGEFFVQVAVDGEVAEYKVPHRKYLYLDARPAPKVPPQGLAILDAWYGTGIWGEKTMVEVKKQLAARLMNNRIRVDVKDLVMGLPDPARGQSKALIVRFAFNGEIGTALFEEHQTVTLGE